MENLGEAVTVIHHGGSDHLIVTAAFKEIRQTNCELPKFLNLLTVSATVTEVCQCRRAWAATSTELQFPGHASRARDSRQVLSSLIPTTGTVTTADERIEYGVGWLYQNLFKQGFDNEHAALADSKAAFRFAVSCSQYR